MDQKRKTVIAVIIIFIFTVAVIAFYYQQKNKVAVNEMQPQAAQQNSVGSQTPNAQSEVKTVTVTAVATGTVASIADQKVQIKTATNTIELNIPTDTSIYTLEKGNATAKTFAYLRVGQKIMAEYDTKTNNAQAVKIVSN